MESLRLHHRIATSFPPLFRIKTLPPPLSPSLRHLNFSVKSSLHHNHTHHNNHNHNHNHSHHNHNHNHCSEKELSGAQLGFVAFAKAVRWTELADFLRENLGLCISSAAMLMVAGAAPYLLIPKHVVRPLQNVLLCVAFPLVGAVRWTELADFLRENLSLCCFSAAILIVVGAAPFLMIPKAMQNVLISSLFHLLGHHNHGDCTELTGVQLGFVAFAKAVRWTELADFLRENLGLCVCSAAMLMFAGAAPYLMLPRTIVRLLQNVLICAAFPLFGVELTGARLGFVAFANAVRWTKVADFLRENLSLCCCSAAILMVAGAAPYLLIPKHVVRPLQNALICVAFPLVEISASLDALIDISGGKINIHVLMALAAFASAFMGNPLEGGLLLAMFNLAHIAEEYFTGRSKIDVKELKENNPEFALVLEVNNENLPNFSDLSYKEVPVDNVEVDSYIFVKAGESVPVDCKVFRGRSTITIEHLTGEVKPVDRKVGDSIPGGARNLDGMMIVKVKKSWKESMLNRIVQLTEEAQSSKPKLQRWLDKFGEQYSKVVMGLSVAVVLIGPLLFKWPFLSTPACRGSIYRALGLMVAGSPCALAVAPLAYATAISACAKKGILLKGGQVLDALASCDTIAFDKTGTLTTGDFTCKAIEPIHGHSGVNELASCCVPTCEKEALAVAAAMEQGTTHPIGRAVVDHSVGTNLPAVSVDSFENLPGRGLCATLSSVEPGLGEGKPLKASLGSVEFISSLYNSEDESKKIIEAVNTSSYGNDLVRAALSVNNKKVTLFHFEDQPRSGAENVVRSLQDEGKLHVIMLTGDHESSAWRVANAVGIKEVHCNLKPEDKLRHVTSVSRNTGGGLTMVGDGINDAPALAAATVGIVLAQRASAAAIAVADILLLQDNISGVPFCVAKAHQTTSLVKQNVALALSSIILASLTSVLGVLPLWLTVLLHEGGTLLVCLNSIRALRDPSWSSGPNIPGMVHHLESAFNKNQHHTSPTSIQSAPL